MKYLTSTKACKFFQFCGNAWSPTIDGNLFMYYIGFTTKGVQFPVFRQGFTCIISLSSYHHLMGSCFLIVTGPSVLMRKKRPHSTTVYIHNNKGCLMFYVNFGGGVTSLFLIVMFDGFG